MKHYLLLVALTLLLQPSAMWGKSPKSLKPIKGHIAVLSFDDATVGQRTIVAPLLKKYKFGATFYVCEFGGEAEFGDKTKYMTWEQIKELNDMGFEIGNHSRSHGSMDQQTPEQVEAETLYIEEQCAKYGIPRPVTYAYPGYGNTPEGKEILRKRGYQLARHGGDRPYVQHTTDKMMVPSYDLKDESFEHPERIEQLLDGTRDGEVIVLCLHGVPDLAHDFVSTSPKNFESLLKMLKNRKYKVISMRDLLQYDL
ncbi:MAG: polysaccharide deacetylase family protein [Alistipes sp.]|nr:polysaccharide deacetylase family protein [Alistipes sp.]